MVLQLLCPICSKTSVNVFYYVCGYIVCSQPCADKIRDICCDLFERKLPVKAPEINVLTNVCTYSDCRKEIKNEYYYKHCQYFCSNDCYLAHYKFGDVCYGEKNEIENICSYNHCCKEITNDYYYKFSQYFCTQECYKKWVMSIYQDIDILNL